jgi:D-alanyl-D-alanine carboxypeptidase (penicillin-binding protein 5/6)
MFVGIIVVGFLVWLAISVITIDTKLSVNEKVSIPELGSLSELPDFSYGDNAVAIDGTVVAGKFHNSDEIMTRPTASTAKMILALAVIKEKGFPLGEQGETISIDQEMYNKYVYYITHGGSNTRVMIGEEISEYDALMSVLLASSNNMADALATWAFGSIESYREYATNMLNEWGISNTTIGIDACGFDESTTSTAEDLAKIATKAMEEPILAEIVATKSHIVPVAGEINNTNQLLGVSRITGVKTGFIGDASGYCLITGYKEGEHIVTAALMGAPTRNQSFDDNLTLVETMQRLVPEREIIKAGDEVGFYDSWWTGPVKIIADQDLKVLAWQEAETKKELTMDGKTGQLKIKVNDTEYTIGVTAEEYTTSPSLGEKIAHVFGWRKEHTADDNTSTTPSESSDVKEEEPGAEEPDTFVTTNAPSENCTIKLGALMLINPNFTVEESFIAARRGELVSISELYGIREGVAGNGDNLLDAEAATHINDMVKAYEADNPGHTLETRSCFRSRGTSCGRLCAATGASQHHTGLTCDLIDPVYGTVLDTDTIDTHIEWQWLKTNSYKYGFIDRFPEAWAGGPMSEPLNVDENGSTGLFETWHYRYVGIKNATEIATGKYNNGEYDSLEHYLKMRGFISDLKAGNCN